jgi:hypothetical protein
VLASASAGIAPPIDVVQTDFRALDALLAEAKLARSLGFGGKGCIHPSQVPVVEAAFAPAPAELEWARGVVLAFEQAQRAGVGAVSIGGEMIDLPVYERALEVIEDARSQWAARGRRGAGNATGSDSVAAGSALRAGRRGPPDLRGSSGHRELSPPAPRTRRSPRRASGLPRSTR